MGPECRCIRTRRRLLAECKLTWVSESPSQCFRRTRSTGHPASGPFVRTGKTCRHLKSLMSGGGQEGGLRPGTLPTSLCVGFGEACALAVRERKKDEEQAAVLAGSFLEQLDKAGVTYAVNGSREQRVAQNLNLSFEGVEAEALLAQLPTLGISTGSACSSGSIGPSAVLTAMGLEDDRIGSAVRIGFGRGIGAGRGA